MAAVECVEENAILRGVASAAIEDTGGLFVTTPDDDPAYGDQFLAGCAEAGLPTEEIAVAEALRREPRLNPGIKRAFTVADASVDVWKLVWALANGAATRGARILPYHRCVELRREGDAVTGARLHDERTGETVEVEAGFTINAGGAWAGEIAQMAGIEGVSVVPGKGIMIAMNHRLVNTVVNRCTMPADGDIIVPIRTVSVIGTTDIRSERPGRPAGHAGGGRRDARRRRAARARLPERRALRVWAGVRPLFDDQKAGAADARRQPRHRAAGPRRARRRQRLHHDHRRQADDLPAHGRGGRRRDVPQLGHDRPCTTATTLLPGSEDGAYMSPGDRLRRARGDAAATSSSSASASSSSAAPRGGDAGARLAEPRRHPPQPATGHGAVPGRVLHPARHRDPPLASTARRPRRPTRHRSSFLEERWKGVYPILYGDQLRQARLDDWIFQGVLDVEHLPGDRSGTSRRRPRGRRQRWDVIVAGAGTAGLTTAVRRPSRGGRCSSSPRARAPRTCLR